MIERFVVWYLDVPDDNSVTTSVQEVIALGVSSQHNRSSTCGGGRGRVDSFKYQSKKEEKEEKARWVDTVTGRITNNVALVAMDTKGKGHLLLMNLLGCVQPLSTALKKRVLEGEKRLVEKNRPSLYHLILFLVFFDPFEFWVPYLCFPLCFFYFSFVECRFLCSQKMYKKIRRLGIFL
jgi:hypothetical protein